MPAALPINWDLAKMLYAQGLNAREISEKVGVTHECIRSRVSREKWRNTVAMASLGVAQSAAVMARTPLKERAGVLLEAMAEDVADTLTQVRKAKPTKNMDKMLVRETVLEKLNKRMRSTYGLDDDHGMARAGATNIQVNISLPDGPSGEKTAIVPEC